MKTPIVFCFNDGYLMPAGVCITSLLMNANENTFYDIFILYSKGRLSFESKSTLLRLKNDFDNFEMTFIDVGDQFEKAFEIRGITVETYFRLLVPNVIKGYQKVIYSDVDVIFVDDISKSLELLPDGCPLGAVKIPEKLYSKRYLSGIGLSEKKYFNAGFLVFNVDEASVDERELTDLLKRKFTYQDQDILNILFKDRISPISHSYCYTHNRTKDMPEIPIYIFHYVGEKPWDGFVTYGDVWWEYYRKSMFFDENNYRLSNFQFFDHKLKLSFGYKISKALGLFALGSKLTMFKKRFLRK